MKVEKEAQAQPPEKMLSGARRPPKQAAGQL